MSTWIFTIAGLVLLVLFIKGPANQIESVDWTGGSSMIGGSAYEALGLDVLAESTEDTEDTEDTEEEAFAAITGSSGRFDAGVFRVISIHDGDTLTVSTPDGDVRVRLLGIDAPELDQPLGGKARRFLDACAPETVYLEPQGQDLYGRMLAKVWSSAASIRSCNEQLIESGLAYAFMTESRKLLRVQDRAREEELGVWGDPESIRPFQWRRLHK